MELELLELAAGLDVELAANTAGLNVVTGVNTELFKVYKVGAVCAGTGEELVELDELELVDCEVAATR